MDCTRSITFIIPGIDGAPDVRVTAVENEGAIEFTLDVLETAAGATADLRGLFFNVTDESKLVGLTPVGDDVSDYDTENVIDLGQGANMRGHANPFDFGAEFGKSGIGNGRGDIQNTSFILTNDAGDLTLDEIAHVEFGARLTSIGVMGEGRDGSAKLVTVSPAAPDANDDSYNIFEDGQSGLDDPSTVSEGTVFNVLDNDTDADNDTLRITHVFGAEHGTVEIIDGDDPDNLIGDAVLYTPDTDYSGSDLFTYCITDDNGGTDFAEVAVAIEAVADVPDVAIEALPTDNINEVLLVVTATQTDNDGSEFIDKIVRSDTLPFGVTLEPAGTIDPANQPLQLVQEYLLTLPDQDLDFDITFTATSEELSNGDTETNSATISIASRFDAVSDSITFVADDQNMWASGDDFEFDPDIPFLGVDEGPASGMWGGEFLGGGWNYDIRIGLEQELVIEGGSVDAEIPYDISVDSFYNLTTDRLELDPLVSLGVGGFFMTDGPSLDYELDLRFLLSLGATVEIADLEAFSPSFTVDETVPLIDYDSDTSGPIEIGDEDDALSATLAWPNLQVVGADNGDETYSGNGASNNVLELNLDADQTIANLFLGGGNPFDLGFDAFSDFWETGVEAGLEILDLDLIAGLNFLQDFVLTAGDLEADIIFESGDTFAFDLFTPTQYANASQFDFNGDGTIEFDLSFDDMTNATLLNDTDLNLNVGYDFELLSGSFKAGVLGAVAQGSFGPLFNLEDAADVAQFDVFSDEFLLELEGDQTNFFA